MKGFVFIVILFFYNILNSQTIIQYDNMETSSPLYLTSGWWTPALTATWATNISVSPTQSAVIYGLGNASSLIEQDWYSMPNVTGLVASRVYQLKFRLASQAFTNSTAATRGVDVADYINVQVSRNGGVTYVTELRITGNNNSIWPYTSTGIINHTANGTFTNSAAPTGDIYTAPSGSTTTGPSTITLTMPTGITQLAIDIYCRINSAGEEWWIDNIQLIEINPLPIELTQFNGYKTNEYNVLNWQTASEHNNSHFLLERSVNSEFSTITKIEGAGNSSSKLDYSFIDYSAPQTINYYRLTQVDFDGNSKTYDPISIDNRGNKTVVKYLNVLGQEVSSSTSGLIFEAYDDGSIKKIWR
jgi:hypothetical protein